MGSVGPPGGTAADSFPSFFPTDGPDVVENSYPDTDDEIFYSLFTWKVCLEDGNLDDRCPSRCCASCVTGPASAPVPPRSAPQESHWCWTAAAAARCAPGSEGSPAPSCSPATAREDCSATTAPASPETPGSVSVSASRPSGWRTVCPHVWDKQFMLMFKVCSAERKVERFRLLFPGVLLTYFL